MVKVNSLSPAKRVLVYIAMIFIRLWNKTLKIELSGEDQTALSPKKDTPKIYAFWHNRLFIAAEIYERYMPRSNIYGLISPSKDGAWLTEIYKSTGIKAVRGSSKRRGHEALMELENILNCGYNCALTPDGPRGPRYLAKAGIANLAKKVGTPIVLVGCNFASAWRLKSWDKFYIPKPFSKIRITTATLEPSQYKTLREEELLALIQKKMININRRCL
ncbi:MAG: lysophospholipid acyltransferase family protein [Puniceicoccales bacterium]|jgi:lysophospholipid acyltransferase (LPLAT)-like uncharacterized protein|nr:lysophospholipid acyltransferase family protein [Puniceicoccales bacterium]